MNTKTVRWMLLIGGLLGSAASAFAAPGLLEIQSKASLFNCNPSSPGCLPLQTGSVSWGATNGWGVPPPPLPPPPLPPHGHPAPWALSNLLIGDQIANTNAMLAPRNSSPQISLKSLSKGSQFPLENSAATKVKFRHDAKTNRYILDFGVIKQTANPVEMKLVLKPIEKKEQVYVADFVFKIDASSPGAFSTELPLRDSANPGSLLTIKGVVRGR